MLGILLHNLLITASVLPKLEEAKENIRNGNLIKAENILSSLYADTPKPLVVDEYFKFLVQLGRNEFIEKHGTEKFKKEVMTIKSLLQNKEKNIESLYIKCPYNKNIILGYVTNLCKKKDYLKAFEIFNKAKYYYPNDIDVKKIENLFKLNRGEYSAGIEGLKEINVDIEQFEAILKSFNNVKKIFDPERKFRELTNLLDTITYAELDDRFYPPTYSFLKFDIIDEYVKLGIDIKKNVKRRAKELMEYKKTDKNIYLWLMSMMNEGETKQVEEHLRTITFKDNNFLRSIENQIRDLKMIEAKRKAEEKQRAEEEKRKNEERQRQYQYRSRQQSQSGENSDDPKGFYKLLGVNKNATKRDIKKKYNKLVKEKDPDPYRGKDEKKHKQLSEEMMKINEAKSVLLDDEKRKLYDSGMYGKEQGGGFEGDVGDIFKMFFGGGGFGGFGSGGGSFYSTNGGGSRRTYYFRG